VGVAGLLLGGVGNVLDDVAAFRQGSSCWGLIQTTGLINFPSPLFYSGGWYSVLGIFRGQGILSEGSCQGTLMRWLGVRVKAGLSLPVFWVVVGRI